MSLLMPVQHSKGADGIIFPSFATGEVLMGLSNKDIK